MSLSLKTNTPYTPIEKMYSSKNIDNTAQKIVILNNVMWLLR